VSEWKEGVVATESPTPISTNDPTTFSPTEIPTRAPIVPLSCTTRKCIGSNGIVRNRMIRKRLIDGKCIERCAAQDSYL
jgi:hypothetical protein